MLLRLRTYLREPRAWLPARFQVRGVAVLVLGNLFKIALGIATSAIAFRALGPAGAGQFALTLGIIGLLSIIGEFGLRDAAVTFIARALPTDPERAYSVSRTFFIVKLALSALAGAFAYLAAGWIAATFYPDANIADLLRLGAFSLLTGGLLGFSLAILEARQSFAAISILSVLQAVLRAILILALFAAQEINPSTLLLLEALVPVLVFLYSLRFISKPFFKLRAPYLEHLPAMFHFAKWIAVAAFASTIYLKLDVLLLGYFLAPAQVGLYAVALALVSRLDVLKSAVLTTSFPEATRRTTTPQLETYIRQSLRLTGLASLVVVPLFFLGGAVIEWLYGAAFAGAVSAFIPLLLAFLLGLNVEPIAYVLYSRNRPQWIARMDIGLLALNFGLNLILIPALGIAGAAYGLLFTRFVGAVVTVWLVRRALRSRA